MDANKTSVIRNKINRLKLGETVSSSSFPRIPGSTVNKILSRLVDEGCLIRLKRGVYSKPTKSRFGTVKPSPTMILSQEIKQDDSKCFGGLFLYNQLGLTTQVPTTIEVLNNRSSYKSKIGNTEIRYVKIRPIINKSTKTYIKTLEVIKNIRSIPDGDTKKLVLWLKKNLKQLDDAELNKMIRIASDYPPRVRAILSNLLQKNNTELSEKLKKSLNQNSYYRVGDIVKFLKNPENWNLKE